MHIEKIDIENVKSLARFRWELGQKDARAGWHVFLGDNGAGKTTLLRSVALALLGREGASALRIELSSWVSNKDTYAGISLWVDRSIEWDNRLVTEPNSPRVLGDFQFDLNYPIAPSLAGSRSIWSNVRLFSASFGPYRRFTGGNQETEKLFQSQPLLARHLSLFGEDVAFTETLTWLRDLHYEQLDAASKGITDPAQTGFLDRLKAFINQENFLPNGAQLNEISPKGVFFIDPNGTKIGITELSDGFRSILSLTLELIRQLAHTFGRERIFDDDNTKVMPEGVVIVDEIDVHLHPRWQRAIGPWFTTHFPGIQFLVSTHSPLVCQGAVKGTVTRLPQPGTDDKGGRVTGTALNRLLYGDVLDALGSGAFGAGIERSDIAQELLAELAKLNIRSRRQTLSEAESQRRLVLQDIFGLLQEDGGENA